MNELFPLLREEFIAFLRARERMRLHKEVVGGPGPHSTDPLLASHHFCNVNREDDAVTRWVHENVRLRFQNSSRNFVVTQLTVARIFNHPPALKVIIPVENPTLAARHLEQYEAQGNKVMRGAYMMPVRGEGKGHRVVSYYLETVIPAVLRLDFTYCVSLVNVAEKLMTVKNLGDFLANQICTDLRYMPRWGRTFIDWEMFVLAGPGTKRGINRYYGLDLEQTAPLPWYTRQLMLIRKEMPDEFAEVFLDPNNLSNCFCEFDKYRRAQDQLFAQKKPTLRHYHGNSLP